MFFLLGKSKTKTANGNYPAIVEEIHNEFNISGDRLLKEAKEIIASIQINNESKINELKGLGFGNVKEVTETEAEINKRESQKKLAKVLEYYHVNFPQYKFITQDMALKICEKYNLVLGDVGQFTGFVPDKNLKQIKKFYEIENELSVVYLSSYGGWGSSSEVDREYYESFHKREDDRQAMYKSSALDTIQRHALAQMTREYVHTSKRPLKIAAPLKDMKKEGYQLKGRVFTKEIPDPVVLAPITRNGVGLYCIVTAWGDEASDEMVVNQQSN